MRTFAITNEIGTPSETIAAKLSDRIGASHLILDDITGPCFARDQVINLAGWLGRRVDHLDQWTSRQAIVRQVFEAASRGNVVIQGFCAPAVLAQARHVIRIRIVGSIEERARAIVDGHTCSEAGSAVQMLRAADAECADFAERLLKVDVTDPGLYDITLNSDRVSVDESVLLLCNVLESRARKPEQESLDSVVALLNETWWDRTRQRVSAVEPNQPTPGLPSQARKASVQRLPPTNETLARAEEALYGKLPTRAATADAGNTEMMRPFIT